MTVSRAFALAFGALALGMLFAQSVWLVRLEDERAAERRHTAHEVLGLTLAGSIGAAWQGEGPDEALQLLSQANRFQSSINLRWVWLDEDAQTPLHAPLAPLESVRRDGFSSTTLQFDATPVFVSYTPAQVGSHLGAIEISEPLTDEADRRRALRGSLLGGGAAVLVVFGLVAWALGARLLGRPLRSLSAMATQVGAGALTSRVALRTHTELDALGRSMNAMAQSLERQTRERDEALEQARHSERLATVGKLAAGLAHELGTPLNVVKGRARTLQSGELDDARTQLALKDIVGETDRMSGLVGQLLDFAGKRRSGRTRVPLADLISHTVELLRPIAERKRVVLEARSEPLTVSADSGQLQQVITNLLMNAIQASPEGERVEIEGLLEGARARLSVRDHGPGLSEEVKAHLFEPFFTTRPPGTGTGLGLAVSFGIMKDMDGSIEAGNAEGGGARFCVTLPAPGGAA